MEGQYPIEITLTSAFTGAFAFFFFLASLNLFKAPEVPIEEEEPEVLEVPNA